MFTDVVDRCQVLVGRIDTSEPPDVLRLFTDMVSTLPVLSIRERFTLDGIFGQILSRVAAHTGVDRDPDVMHGFVRLAASTSMEHWTAALQHVVQSMSLAYRLQTPTVLSRSILEVS